MTEYSAYLSAVARCINQHDGAQLAKLLDVSNQQALSAAHKSRQGNPNWDPGQQCRRLRQPWDEIFMEHSLALAALQVDDPVEAYDHLLIAVPPFVKFFREEQNLWCVAPLRALAHNLYRVALAADAHLQRQGQKADRLAHCGNELRKPFTASLQASGNKAKKAACLDIINVMMRIYFRLNTLRLCKNLTATVDKNQILPLEQYPLSHRVTYSYFVGRLSIFDEQYGKALDQLRFAFANCPASHRRNRARILQYLVPVHLLLGGLPTPQLLLQFGLQHYEPIVQAMRTGAVSALNSALMQQQDVWIQAGTYLLLEKLRLSVYRRLFRRVALLHAETPGAKANQVPLSAFHDALAWQGVDVDLDEAECVVANLIFRGYIRGYISHSHRVVVIAKVNPFPPLSSVALTDP